MPLSEHVYCVAVTFKMIEQVEQWICTKFCIKLEHSSMETIQIIHKDTVMGNGWLAASTRQHAHISGIKSHAEFLVKHQITQVTSFPVEPRFGALWLLAFPQTKITFEPWLVWLSGLSTSLQTKGLSVGFPIRAHAWVLQARSPVQGVWEATTQWCFSPSFPLPPFPSV